MPVVNPGHLLDQSDELIGNPRGGAPRQADLRRAISNSYYALFHAILCEAADDFVCSGRRQSARYAMVEVFLIALMVLVLKSMPGGSYVELHAGTWLFTASVALSLIAAQELGVRSPRADFSRR